jgi:hypothetical protein
MIINIKKLEEVLNNGIQKELNIEKQIKRLESIRTTISKINQMILKPDIWLMENNEGAYGIDIIIRNDGFIDICAIIKERYNLITSYVRLGYFQTEFSLGYMYFADGKIKEYKRLGNILNAIIKEYEKYGLYVDTSKNKEILKQSRQAYKINNDIKQEHEEKIIARDKDKQIAINMIREHDPNLFTKRDVEVEEVRNGRFGTYKEKVIIQCSDADDLIAEFMCIHIKYGRKDAIKHLKNLLSYIPKK